MYDSHGHPLSPKYEFEQIVQYFSAQFIDPDFRPCDLAPLEALPFDLADVQEQLKRLPATKALAPPCLPAIVWKHLAPDLSQIVYHALRQCWTIQPNAIPEHWMARWFHLIPKPGKPCNKPQALRPICLQHPLCKVASSFAARSIMQYSVPQLIKFLLYAYLPHRGTTDCLLRVSEHCRIVRDRCIAHAKDDVPHGLFGGSSNLIRHGKSL